MLAISSDTTDDSIDLLDPVIETGEVLHLVLDLLRDQWNEKRGVKDLADMLPALRFADKYDYRMLYRLIVNYLKAALLLMENCTSGVPFQVFVTAAALDDKSLACEAVEALKRCADACLGGLTIPASPYRHWPEDLHNCLHQCKFYPCTWTPAEYDSVPAAYHYAIMRTSLPHIAEDKKPDTSPVGTHFQHFLKEYQCQCLGDFSDSRQ